jgi:7-cyano-7-deazaguanine synthase
MNTTCYVLLSGGQDSTTCLFWAKKKFETVIAIGFDYGQRHAIELQKAKEIAKIANVPFEIINIKGLLSGSSLTDYEQQVTDAHVMDSSLPSSFTAGRNMLFLTLAASKGYNNNVFDIVTGVCQTDYSGYPDCRRVFIDSLQTTLTLAMVNSISNNFRIHTPLMYLTKAETWKLAKELSTPVLDVVEIVRKMTLTDYNGDTTENEWGMGKLDNPASELRAKGYYEAKANNWI